MIWTAFILGMAGSLHCLGMCGPLALALPSVNRSRFDYLAGRILYNLGRVMTYALMGVLVGLIGKTFALAGWQRALSIGAGVIMLLAAASVLRFAPTFHLKVFRDLWTRLFAKRTKASLLGIGLLNGLLPCGLVYVALAGAATTGTAAGGASFMAVFGLGTFPAMLAVSLFGHSLNSGLRLKFQRAVPAVVMLVGVLLVLRGLDLGIPYLSPALSGASHCCAH